MSHGPSTSWLPAAGAWSGVGISAFGYGMDALGIGAPGFGSSQLAIVAAGGLILLGSLAAMVAQRSGRVRFPDPPLPADETADPGSLVRVVLAIGLFAGLLDPALQLALNGIGLRFLYVNAHMSWMSPLSYVGFFFIFAALVRLAARGRWRWLGSVRGLTGVLGGITVWSLAYKLHPELHVLASVVLAAGAGAQIFRGLPGGARGVAVLRRAVVPVLMLILVSTAVQVGGPALSESRRLAALPDAEEGAPDVLLIILDTVRQLNTSLAGYVRETTPHLALRAEQGVVFDRAISTSPWSAPSHASLVTGAYPAELDVDWLSPLEEGVTTLAEVLSGRGYRAGGFFANKAFGGRHTALDRGTLHWDVDQVSWLAVVGASTPGLWFLDPDRLSPPRHNHNERTTKKAPEVFAEFLKWRERNPERPYFAMLNLFDAHDPYDPPEGYEGRFGASDRPVHPNHSREPTEKLNEDLDGYDALIAYLDDEMEKLFETLRADGSLEHTLVIVTSDHGEEFGETGQVLHGNGLGFPVLNVPLFVSLPGRIPQGQRVSRPVTIRDIPATILDFAGTGPEQTLPGRSLARFWDGSAPADIVSDPVFAMVTDRSWIREDGGRHSGNILAAFDSTYQYLLYGEEGEEELFDVGADPWEEHNLAADPAVAPALERFRRATSELARSFMQRNPGSGAR